MCSCRFRSGLLGMIGLVLLAGCGTAVSIKPEITGMSGAELRVEGKVVFDGNHEYLPRTIVQTPASQSGLSFRYFYDVRYETDNVPELLKLINLLALLGFPIGEDTLIVVGRLDVIKKLEVVKSYEATCSLVKTRNLFWEGPTLSDLQKEGLFAVRDNIEAQMSSQRTFFIDLTPKE